MNATFSPVLSRFPPENEPSTVTPGYRVAIAAAFLATTPYPPAGSVTFGNVKSIPSLIAYPSRFSGEGPVFLTSMNSKSCAVYGPDGGAGGLYIISVMRSGSTPNPYRLSASPLHLFPGSSVRARIRWVVLIMNEPVYWVAPAEIAPALVRGSLPSVV